MPPRFEKVRSRAGEWILSCGEVITFLFEYLEDDVAEERKREFERHLELCPSCRNYLDTYRESLRLARDAERSGEAEIPELPEHLLQAILRAGR